MIYGYARVSTSSQDGNGQVKELEKVCDRVELERASGGRWDRPCLQNILRGLKAGDVLVVWKIDRLSRSLKDLLHILEKITEAGAGFRSLTEAFDTSTPVGRMTMQLLGSFGEFERSMIRERVREGLKHSTKKSGRPEALTEKKKELALRMIEQENMSQTAVAREFDVSVATVCRLVNARLRATPA